MAMRSSWEVAFPNAAGIDVGGAMHFAAIPPDRGSEVVRKFGVCTAELHQMAQWLIDSGIDTVAMESTGVYWIPVFEILERRGLRVVLVNAPARAQCARAQVRRCGLSVAAAVDELRAAARRFPP